MTPTEARETYRYHTAAVANFAELYLEDVDAGNDRGAATPLRLLREAITARAAAKEVWTAAFRGES